ncbi:MAG: hypothetical protein ABGW86_04395 [Candidatus Poseidoniia archaeon]
MNSHLTIEEYSEIIQPHLTEVESPSTRVYVEGRLIDGKIE